MPGKSPQKQVLCQSGYLVPEAFKKQIKFKHLILMRQLIKPIQLKPTDYGFQSKKYLLKMPIEYLFRFYETDGIVPMYKSKMNRDETAFFTSDEDENGPGQIQDFTHITFKGVMFKMWDRRVDWTRGTIKPTDLYYRFWKDNVEIIMWNKTHIKKNTKSVDFVIQVDFKPWEGMDDVVNMKMKFDDSKPIQLHSGDTDYPLDSDYWLHWTFEKL